MVHLLWYHVWKLSILRKLGTRTAPRCTFRIPSTPSCSRNDANCKQRSALCVPLRLLLWWQKDAEKPAELAKASLCAFMLAFVGQHLGPLTLVCSTPTGCNLGYTSMALNTQTHALAECVEFLIIAETPSV